MLAWVAFAGQARSDTPVTLALRWDHQFQFAGYYAALWQGYYAEEGLAVTLQPAVTPEGTYRLATEEVASGRAQFGIGGADILVARDRGAPLVVLACIFQQSGARFFYRADRPVRSLADLPAMRVIRREGDLVDIEMQALLNAEGIDPATVKPIPHDLSKGYFHDLAANNVDVVPGYSIGSPYEAQRIGLDVNALRPADFGVDFYGDSLFTTEPFATKNPDVVRRFRRASLRGWRYALEHPDEIVAHILSDYQPAFLLHDYPGFVRFQVGPVTELTMHPIVEVGHVNPDRWQHMHELLHDAGVVEGRYDPSLIWQPDDRTWAQRNGTTMAYAAGGGLLGLGAILGWNVLLRRLVRRRTGELARSRQRYKSLVDNQTDLIVEFDKDLKLTYVSPSCCRLLDKAPEELVGQEFMKYIDEADRPFIRQSLERLDGPEGQSSHEERVHTPHGTRWLSWRNRAIEGPDGQGRTYVGVGRDITDRIQAEQALRESELRFRAIANCTSDWENWIGPEGQLLWVNQAVAKHTGYSAEECRDMPEFPLPIIHPDSREIVREHLSRCAKQESGNDEEIRICRKDGSTAWMSVSFQPIYNDEGTWLGHRSSLRDITPRKHAQQKLQESEALLAMAQEVAQIGSWTYDMASGEVTWSPQMFRVFGLDPAEGTPGYEDHRKHIHPDDVETFTGAVQRSLTTGEPYQMQLRMIRPDGEVRTFLTYGQAVTDAAGKVVELRGTSQDITERKALEARLAETQKLESLGVLAGGVAHDFNNLLVGILGNVELALEEVDGDDENRQLLEEIRLAGQRAADLTGKMLAFSGHGRFIVADVSLNELVRDVQRLTRSVLPRGTRLTVRLDESNPTIQADADQIRQILLNLILNAAESYGEEPGEVVVQTGSALLGPEFFAQGRPGLDRSPGRYGLITVSDRGCGMDADTLGRAYEPFFTTKFTGRGLGLAAALGMVRGHGGSIQATSTPGEGTTFTVALPQTGQASQPEQTPAAPTPATGSPDAPADDDQPVVLVVDDEDAVLNVASRMLRKLGLRTITISGGAEALHVLEDKLQPADLLIVDLSMPGIDGQEVCQHSRRVRPGVPVVLSTGYSKDAARSQLTECHADAFLQKPYTFGALKSVVERLIG